MGRQELDFLADAKSTSRAVLAVGKLKNPLE